MKRHTPLLYSDVSYGTEEWGFLPRAKKRPDAEEEDIRYERFLQQDCRVVGARVVDGYVWLPNK